MYDLPKKIKDLKPYDPITGDYKIRLDANESFIRIDDEVIMNALKKISLNRYPDPIATTAINAFAECYGISPDNVTAGNGSDELISLVSTCFFEKGMKGLSFSPDFSMYSFYPYLNEIKTEILQKNDDLTIDVDKAIKYINDNKINAVMFSNPCNPTSLGLSKSDVRHLIEGTNALIVLDEAYMDFWTEEESLLNEVNEYDNLIIFKTCSKALAMAGIRLGFAVANKKITNALRAAKSPYNVNSITQTIGAEVLSDKKKVYERINAVKKSIESLYNGICALNKAEFQVIYKPVTNFVFIKTAYGKEIYEYLLDNSIAIRFMGDYIRISCGTDEENAKVIEALKNFRR